MAPNQNFDNFTFLVGPDLVQKQSFIKNSISYLARDMNIAICVMLQYPTRDKKKIPQHGNQRS